MQEKNQDAIRDLQIKQLSAAKESEKHAEMLAELLAAHPAHIPLLSEAMQRAVRRHPLWAMPCSFRSNLSFGCLGLSMTGEPDASGCRW